MFKNLFKSDVTFFDEDEEGRKIFYPWGRPGKGFYINKQQRKNITAVTFFIGLMFVSMTYAGFFKYDSNIYCAIWLWTSAAFIPTYAYIAYVLIYIRINKLDVYQQGKAESQPIALRALITAFIVGFLILLFGVSIDPSYSAFKFALIGLIPLFILSYSYLIYASKFIKEG